MSNSTLHNTAGRTQAVNISAAQSTVAGEVERGAGGGSRARGKKKIAREDESSKIAALRSRENGKQPVDQLLSRRLVRM